MRFEQNKNGYHEFETPQCQPRSGQLGSIEQAQNKLSPEPAEYLLSIVFAEGDREGMTLAVRSESGVLTAD